MALWVKDIKFIEGTVYKKGNYWLRCWDSHPHWFLYRQPLNSTAFVACNDELQKEKTEKAFAWADIVIDKITKEV